jgi:hypothetical protein
LFSLQEEEWSGEEGLCLFYKLRLLCATPIYLVERDERTDKQFGRVAQCLEPKRSEVFTCHNAEEHNLGSSWSPLA